MTIKTCNHSLWKRLIWKLFLSYSDVYAELLYYLLMKLHLENVPNHYPLRNPDNALVLSSCWQRRAERVYRYLESPSPKMHTNVLITRRKT